MSRFRGIMLLTLLAALLLVTGAVVAQEDFPPADIVNDEGGPVFVSGLLQLTNPNIKLLSVQPIIILEDQAGFVDRDIEFNFPQESQVFAVLTSDFYADAPVSYELVLPAEPRGSLRDVDNDGGEDAGVQVYAVAHWDNRFGQPFVDERDGYGWSSAYASTRASVDPSTLYEIIGGQYLIYAPEDGQGFPSGFGEDGLLFSEDDPIVGVPQGWTLVNMDDEPFTFDRSREVEIELHEPEELQLEDYSDMTYTEAFNAFIDLASNEYAFTEYKDVDWEAIREEFLPQVEAAEEDEDLDAFILALDSMMQAIPDGHWQFPSLPSAILDSLFAEETSGGYGMTLRELTNGDVITIFLTPDGPAAEAGIEPGAVITEWDGMAIDEAIDAVIPFAGVGSEDGYRYQQVRYLTRDPLGSEADVTFINPGGEEETVTLETSDERASFAFASVNRGLDQTAPPLTYRFLDSGYGYVKITSFFGNEPLMLETWDYFMTLVRDIGVQGIIIDMRQNGGGFSFIGDRIAGYFFEEEQIAGNRQEYNPVTGEFFSDPNFPTRVFPAEDPSLIFNGPVAVLVGPGCASACEFFTHSMSLQGRAEIVGQYSTAGLGGGWEEVYLPDGLSIALPVSRPVDAEGNIIIEGTGIEPTIRVPVEAEPLLVDEDSVLVFAERYLNEALGVVGTASELTVTEGGEIAVGDVIEAEIAVGERIAYLLTAEEDATLTISMGEESGTFDTYLRVYDAEGIIIAENDDRTPGENINALIEELEVAAGDTIIIEAATFGDGSEGAFVLEVTAGK
jgi:C-terminal processing protease CtpA/Prc